jgi:hypothetical protein
VFTGAIGVFRAFPNAIHSSLVRVAKMVRS